MPGVRVGVISDTHGALPDEAVAALEGIDHIIHAGDVGARSVLLELEAIAPVTAVRGNMDRGDIAWALPLVARVEVAGVGFLVAHEPLHATAAQKAGPAADVVVYGHTHVASIDMRGGALWVNPGSASRARGGHGRSVAIVEIQDGVAKGRIVET